MAIGRFTVVLATLFIVAVASSGSTSAIQAPRIDSLVSGQPKAGIQVSPENWADYSITVPAGVSHFNVTMTGTGDIDLYTRLTALPETNAFDCRSNATGANETCNHTNPSPGIWNVSALGGPGGGTVTITATYCWPLTVKLTTSHGQPVFINDGDNGNCPGGTDNDYSHNSTVTYNATHINPQPLFAAWLIGPVGGAPQVHQDNPYSAPITGPVEARPVYAYTLTPGIPLPNQTNPTSDGISYAIQVPANVASLTFTLTPTSGEPAMNAFLLQGPGCVSQKPGLEVESCTFTSPAPGTWYASVFGDAGSTFTIQATVTLCYTVHTTAFPVGAGAVIADPAPNCNNNTGYAEGTEVTFSAQPELGYDLAYWVTDEAYFTEEHTITVTDDNMVVNAIFGRAVEDSTPVNLEITAFDSRQFYINVPPNAQKLTATLAGTGNVQLRSNFGSPAYFDDNDCHSNGPDSNEQCVHEDPQAGQWWFEVASNIVQGGDVTLTVTIDDCFAMTVFFDNEGGSVTMDPPPDCTVANPNDAGDDPAFGTALLGHYSEGTEVELTAQPNPGYLFANWDFASVTGVAQNPSTVIMSADRSAKANFAQVLTPGVPTSTFTVGNAEWRYFAVDVPEGATLLEVNLTHPTNEGDIDLYTRRATPPVAGETDCLRSSFGSPTKCEHLDPAPGTWWIGVRGFASASTVQLTATISTTPFCYKLETAVLSPGSGTIVADPLPDCDNNTRYTRGTEVTLNYQAGPGEVFAAWRTSENTFATTSEPTVTVNMTQDREVEAYVGIPLVDGQSVPEFQLDTYQARMFYIDVPAGFESLRFAITGSPGGGYGARFESPLTQENGKYVCGGAVNNNGSDECAVPDPAAGRWWFVAHSPTVDGSSFAFTVTLSQESVCFPVTLAASPSFGGTLNASIPPNCPGGYEYGTPLTLTAVPNPGYAAFSIGATNFQGAFGPNLQLDVQYPEFAQFDFIAQFSQAVTPGTPLTGAAFEPQQYRYFHIDVPPGAAQLSATSSTVIVSAISPAFDVTSCFIDPCTVEEPAPGRWFFELHSGIAGAHSLTVTFTLLPEATVGSVSKTTFISGFGPVTFSVFGSGFTPQSIVRWDGAELETTFISTTELQATVTRDLTYGPARQVIIDVVQGSQANAQGAESPAASNGIGVTLTRSQSDVDCNSETTASDITWLLQYLVGLVDARACNTNADGQGGTTIADALHIRRELAGLAQPVPASPSE